METQEQIAKNIYYAHDIYEDKHYFGAFLNLAQNNIGQVFSEFCTRLNEPKDENVHNIIIKYFSNNVSYSDWDKRIKILKEYLPVIEHLNLPTSDNIFEEYQINEKENKKRDYFRKNFQSLIKSVNDLRNFYTHYYHPPVVIDESLFDFLDSLLLKTCLTVRKKKMKNDKTRQILKKGIIAEWKVLEELKVNELKKNKEKNKWINIDDKEGIRNAILNDSFHHLIFKDKDSFCLKDYHKAKYSKNIFAENKIPISKSGLVFLLSLFLTKKETEQLKANIEGFKAKVIGKEDEVTKKNNSLKYMATHWVFSYLTYKGLKRRVSTSFNKVTLLTQMLDELSKVPDEVYQTFSISDKDEFLEDINEFVQESTGDDKSLIESTVVHPVIRKRYENKFNYFAIRFLDEYANFPTLKFQIFAGLFQHDHKTKNIGESNYISDRQIKEKINVFGKLSKVAKYKSDYFTENENENEWHLFPNPSYNFVGNNIHIYFDMYRKGAEVKSVQEEINALRKIINPKKDRVNRKGKKEIIDMIYNKSSKIEYNEPTALFSLNELPAILYEFLINKKTGEDLENILVQKIVERYKTIKNYNTTQQLSNSFITKKLRKSSLKQDQINIEKLLRSINKEIEINGEKLNLIKTNKEETTKTNKQDKPERKYIFYTNELGQEATWLANDLVRFMPKFAKTNWKGYQHSELQRLLAFYDRHKNEAKTLLTTNWDLNSFPIWGSDINEAFDKDKFDEFYEEYLKKRKKTLEGFANTIELNKNDPKLLKKVLKEVFIAFDKRLFVISSIDKQKNELLAKPIVFPRGIFDNKPTFILGQKVEQAPSLYADWYSYCYDKSLRFQKFYDFNRECTDSFEKYEVENKESKLNKKNLSRQQKIDLFKKKQDLLIKKVQHKDIFIKHMIDYLFFKVFKKEIDISLNEIYQTKEERLNNQIVAIEQRDREKGDKSENKLIDNFIWNKTISMSLLNGQIIEPDVKLKDIGKFKKLETDKKVHHLLSYDKTKIWNKLMLEDELENKLDSYERIRREKLLKLVQLFEKGIIENHSENNDEHPKEFEKDGKPNFRKYIAKGVLKKNTKIAESEINWLSDIKDMETVEISEVNSKSVILQKAYTLILLRNKFGHNQLPDKNAFDMMQTLYKTAENETYSKYFLRVTEQIINEFS